MCILGLPKCRSQDEMSHVSFFLGSVGVEYTRMESGRLGELFMVNHDELKSCLWGERQEGWWMEAASMAGKFWRLGQAYRSFAEETQDSQSLVCLRPGPAQSLSGCCPWGACPWHLLLNFKIQQLGSVPFTTLLLPICRR